MSKIGPRERGWTKKRKKHKEQVSECSSSVLEKNELIRGAITNMDRMQRHCRHTNSPLYYIRIGDVCKHVCSGGWLCCCMCGKIAKVEMRLVECAQRQSSGVGSGRSYVIVALLLLNVKKLLRLTVNR